MNRLQVVALAILFLPGVIWSAVLVDANGIIVGYTQEPCGSTGCHGYGYGGSIVGTGPRGVQGLTGADGAPGPKGDTGATGAMGPQGAKGDTGAKGDQGVAGAPGASITGPKGDKGDKGDQGVAGMKGDTGPQGPAGQTVRTPQAAPAAPNKAEVEQAAKDALDSRLTVNVGATVRWYDWKYISLNSGYRYDVHHHDHTVDAAIIQIKLGRSYEERELDKLKAELRGVQRTMASTWDMGDISSSQR